MTDLTTEIEARDLILGMAKVYEAQDSSVTALANLQRLARDGNPLVAAHAKAEIPRAQELVREGDELIAEGHDHLRRVLGA